MTTRQIDVFNILQKRPNTSVHLKVVPFFSSNSWGMYLLEG